MAFYHAASVFVLPSYYREGLPRTILEAMSTGRAVITTDWPGCRDAVENGKNGFLVEPKNSPALAERMIDLATDKELLASMADAAYERCKNQYEVGIINARMKEIIGY